MNVHNKRSMPLRILLLLIAMPFPASSLQAAWHDEHRGTAIRAHHVHLSGHGGDNARQRRLLAEAYSACADTNPRLGLPVQALPTGGIPAIVSSHEIDIYYAPGRTLTIRKGTLQHLDHNNCAVVAQEHSWLEIESSQGKCEIDLIRQRTRGPCTTHATESGPARGRAERRIDLSKVPEHLRAQVSGEVLRLRRGRPEAAPGGSALSATGLTRTIAGQRCEVYGNAALASEVCIARPESRFPIPAAPLNAGIPGLLLDASTPALTITSQQVTLDLGLCGDAFDIPPDIRHGGGNP